MLEWGREIRRAHANQSYTVANRSSTMNKRHLRMLLDIDLKNSVITLNYYVHSKVN